MKLFAILFCFAINMSCFAQNDFFNTEGKRVIDAFFEGFHKGDTAHMSSVMTNYMRLTSAFVLKNGTNNVTINSGRDFLTAVANRPADQVWKEILKGYKGQIDGNLAHIWVPYEFRINGELSHCGANSFTLVKTDQGWKIADIVDSRRREGCE